MTCTGLLKTEFSKSTKICIKDDFEIKPYLIDLQWFAPEDEGKTEKPTEHRLRKAREEGRVPKSQELNGAIVFLLCSVLLVALGPFMMKRFEYIFEYFFNNVTSSRVNNPEFYLFFLQNFLLAVLPFAGVGLVAGVLANIIQNRGFLFTTKTITPKFSKIVPRFGQYFKKTLFSFQGVFNLFKSILKIAILGVICFFMIRREIPKIAVTQLTGGPMLAIKLVGSLIGRMLLICAIILVLIGVADYFVQRKSFMDEMKMSKQEVKQEYKEMDGDPEVKQHLEQSQREMLRTNIAKAVRESDVVIANPTHYAVALQWQMGTQDSPQVTAKGEDLTALQIKKIAKDNDVPIQENKPLARTLYTNLEVGDIIPIEYAMAVATVYREIGYLEKHKQN